MEGNGAQEQEVVSCHLVGDGGVTEHISRQLGGSHLTQLSHHVCPQVKQVPHTALALRASRGEQEGQVIRSIR